MTPEITTNENPPNESHDAKNHQAKDRLHRARHSLLWSAWADALGFISELTTETNLKRRTGGRPLTSTMPWSRQLARHAPRVDLPAGCYSDDTQLRLATSRAISANGFDAEAFARVELPVWLCYALGGGRATKAAAAGMAKQHVGWAANFYPGWVDAGGNGAAMRIQPHVYAAANLDAYPHLDQVVQNAIITHGHPRAIVGAVLHAAALTDTMRVGQVPPPPAWSDLFQVAHAAVTVVDRQPEIAAFWKPRWESTTGRTFSAAWHHAVDEAETLVRDGGSGLLALEKAGNDRTAAAHAYDQIVAALRLDHESTRGSGIATSIAALLLAAAYPDSPIQCAQLAAARLRTDTDTIATMAAALAGVAAAEAPTSPVQDEEYLTAEAERLTRIAGGDAGPPFLYPDLLRFEPPKTALDGVGLVDQHLALSGLSRLHPHNHDGYHTREASWRWATTSFGQTMLIKHRPALRPLPLGNWPAAPSAPPPLASRPSAQHDKRPDHVEQQTSVFDFDEYQPVSDEHEAGQRVDETSRQQSLLLPELDIGVIVDWLDRRGYDDRSLGYAIRRVVESGRDEQIDAILKRIARELKDRLVARPIDGKGRD